MSDVHIDERVTPHSVVLAFRPAFYPRALVPGSLAIWRGERYYIDAVRHCAGDQAVHVEMSYLGGLS